MGRYYRLVSFFQLKGKFHSIYYLFVKDFFIMFLNRVLLAASLLFSVAHSCTVNVVADTSAMMDTPSGGKMFVLNPTWSDDKCDLTDIEVAAFSNLPGVSDLYLVQDATAASFDDSLWYGKGITSGEMKGTLVASETGMSGTLQYPPYTIAIFTLGDATYAVME